MTSPSPNPETWWASLVHGGMLIAPARIAESFPTTAAPLPGHLADRLRRDLLRLGTNNGEQLGALLDLVFEDVLQLKPSWWTKGSEVDVRWSIKAVTGETLKPRRVWHALVDSDTSDSHREFVLPLFVADHAGAGERLGRGRGRRAVSRVTEWLRRLNQPVAVVTNGRQWRLVHAGADYDAWCEWDTDLWFEEGEPGAQLTALRTLLSPQALQPPRAGEHPPLVAAILASRRGQAELSAALGERVRQAVERLIQESAAALDAVDGNGPQQVSRRELYIAATRLVMRCVVVLFAEARDLLPRDNTIYHGCYGLQGLREQLARLAGGRAERLRHSFSAWPRMLGLFDLIRRGSAHEALPIPAYGGGLFEPGHASSADGVLRAIAAFESPANAPSDHCIHQILELLTVSKVKVRQGRASTWVNAPVDFSDLSSEYIGILYEGLLDFELHRAPPDDAIVFLRLGDEPALPLSRLEQEMAPKVLAELIGKLGKSARQGEADEEGDDDEAADGALGDEADDRSEGSDSSGTDDGAALTSESEAEPTGADAGAADTARVIRERASIWAEKAVKEARLVPYPRNDQDPVVRDRWASEVRQRAQSLYRLVLPGQWYLVRWGGTRKGAGTFYTRPQLAVPTVRRTLQPMCYTSVEQQTDAATGLTTVTRWAPRTPEEILALRICDPAMGSGSFLVSSLRYVTDALVESLHAHGRLHARADGAIVKLADGQPLEHPTQETVPLPLEHEDFDDRLRARLKRHVVERCIYGVDMDPLAVELARMALWIETMDRRLPFGFLDHKLRCGNALVGTWFDRFQDYPVMAFARDDAGDKDHRFVHHYREYEAKSGKKKGEVKRSGDRWTQAWKDVRDDVIKPQMRELIEARGPQLRTAMVQDVAAAHAVHDNALAVFRKLHDLPVHASSEREELFRHKIAENPELAKLRDAFDAWCAIWFWPGDQLAHVPTPLTLHDLPAATREIVRSVRSEHRFFHWELEFPDVFTDPRSGFDAMVGNPPWEIQKPNSKEYFSNIDPLYRTYGKQQALAAQQAMFERDARVEAAWIGYKARFKSFSTWNRSVAFPFGDAQDGDSAFALSRSPTDSAALHTFWRTQRSARAGYADEEHPYRHQGSADINTYKMFVEAARALLRDDGVLGFIVPSGIYTDKGSTELRRLLLERNRWEWLFGFENRQKLFDIDSRFKFNPIIVRKGGQTTAIRTAFMHRAVEDWQEAERHVLAYPRERVAQFSPRSSAILEIRSERDLAVLEKMYRNSVLLGDEGPDGWGIRYTREFDMTNDSKLFPPRQEWERKGYRPNEYGMWIGPDGDVALPLYEGRMIGQFDFSEKGWVRGKGRTAVWREIPWDNKVIEPQYLMAVNDYAARSDRASGTKVSHMRIGSATNARSTIASVLSDVPTGDTAAIFWTSSTESDLALVAVLNSLPFDFVMRARLGGLHLDYHVFDANPLPNREAATQLLSEVSARLNLPHVRWSRTWRSVSHRRDQAWRRLWAVAPHERRRLRVIVEVLSAHTYGLEVSSLSWLLNECDQARDFLGSDTFARTVDPKGFWRVDKDKDPELRHTVLTQVAFHDLQRLGLDAFLNQNDGEGWMLPETLRLADYGLGHDDRAREHQPVASRLGPRFFPWQLEQGVEESWDECARHAERIDALLGGASSAAATAIESHATSSTELEKPTDGVTDLFGQHAAPPKSRRRR
ncbi:MAG: hypothetical protein IT361_02925 [Gemmatimonadaceae bacterium]|nr:hypothetical protein [Gemmatimonadaceae bacterium]